MKGKTVEYWKTVVFTDESKIKISGSDGCVFVWRKSTEEWLPCCTLGTVKTGQPSLMIWVCMSYVGVGPLAIVNGSVTCAKYRRILQKHFLLLVAERQHGGKATILQDDNAPVHRASVVTSWKNNHCLESFEWPVQSPDLNPIKNFWMVLKKAISKRCPPPKTISNLQAVIREEWEKIPNEIVRTLIESIIKKSQTSH